MPGKKPEPTQREKFEAAAEAYEKANGEVSDADLDRAISGAGKAKPVKEEKARRKAGMPPASH